MVFFHGKRYIIPPEFQQPVRLFPAVAIDLKVNACRQGIDITGDPACGVKGLGIGQIVYQLHKISSHFVGALSRFLLNSFPAVFIFLYEQAFAQKGKLMS